MVGLRVDCYSISYIDIHSVSLQRLTTMTWMLVALSTVLELAIAQSSGQVPPVVIPGAVGTADLRACPMEEGRKIVRDIIHNAVMDILQPPRLSLFQTVELDCGIKWPSSTCVTQHSSVHLPGGDYIR